MISKTLERVVNDSKYAQEDRGYLLRASEMFFLLGVSSDDELKAIINAYQYGFIRGKRAAEAGRSKKK